eukprot:TRINITY_DN5330_c0_g1_i1.p1 TRINITY_DN5330_c0_g1~~TRINITY_DN5330_c0_g1_i1.p1  ORF type:complete len:499 (-),score=132.28 TRINITY_DN5330_c0_g1_i1:30-1484(-)
MPIKSFVLFLALSSVITFTGASDNSDSPIKIDPTSTFGVWQGWGTSLAWWANQFGHREDLADLFFTDKYVQINGNFSSNPGLNLNIVRYNAGACSYNSFGGKQMVKSPRIPHFKQIDSYWLDWASQDPNSGSWNWTVDEPQRVAMLNAKKRGANYFELFSNSPPWWMLQNLNPSGASNGGNNLSPSHYRDHAIYMATIAKEAIKRWNITFTSVEAFNEPLGGWWKASGTQEGCHFDDGPQSSVLPMLREEMDKRGITSIPVASSDENTYDSALKTWNSFSPDVKKKVSKVNVHGYQQYFGNRKGLYQATKGKSLWNSEFGDGDASGFVMAGCLLLDLNQLHPTAWVYWQLIDGGGWGLIAGNVAKATLGRFNTKYYVLAQFSRHIRQGFRIIGVSGDQYQRTVAAYEPVKGVLVIITLNQGPARSYLYDLSAFKSVDQKVEVWTTVIRDGSKLYEKGTSNTQNKVFKAMIEEKTIQTFQFSAKQ